MLKFVVFAALCACVFAEGKHFRREDGSYLLAPKDKGLAYHVSFTVENQVTEIYAIDLSVGVAYMKAIYPDGKNVLQRCDNGDKDFCYIKIKTESECEEVRGNAEDLLYSVVPPYFNYEYLEAASCPPGVSGECLNYTTNSGIVRIVDSENRIVRVINGHGDDIFVTYHDDVPTESMFNEASCDGDPLPEPVPCHRFYSKLDCLFHVTIESGYNMELYGIRRDGDIVYAKLEVGPSAFALMRCATTNYTDCYCETSTPEACGNEMPLNPTLLAAEAMPSLFAYAGDKQSVPCPGGSGDCSIYTNFFGGFVIADSEDRIVQFKLYGKNVSCTHNSDVPTIDFFDAICNETVLPPIPEDICEEPSSSSSQKASSGSLSSSSQKASSGSLSSSSQKASSGSLSSSQKESPISSASFIQAAFFVVLTSIFVALF